MLVSFLLSLPINCPDQQYWRGVSGLVFPWLLEKIKTDTNLEGLQGKLPRGTFLPQTRPPNTGNSEAKHHSGADRHSNKKKIIVK